MSNRNKLTIILPNAILAHLRDWYPAPTKTSGVNNDAGTLYRALAELLAQRNITFTVPEHGGDRRSKGRDVVERGT